MLSQMTIGKKLTAAFGALVLLVLGLGGAAYWTVGSLGGDLKIAVTVTAKKLD
ncbi:MAG: hypothetical protein JNK48_28955, partial [Bryobacterales bacterium]|nr:hypothetical protein [Bryobacterales bacterium]